MPPRQIALQIGKTQVLHSCKRGTHFNARAYAMFISKILQKGLTDQKLWQVPLSYNPQKYHETRQSVKFGLTQIARLAWVDVLPPYLA